MNRRGFIKMVAAVAALSPIAISNATCCPTVLTDIDKELIIAKALMTDQGRAALARAMCEPIRRALNYQSVGRKLLMVDTPSDVGERYNKALKETIVEFLDGSK
jgi:hypothetical protein